MIVRTLDEVVDNPSHVRGETWQSRRMLLSGDGMEFSLSDTIVREGSEQWLHYKHHLEVGVCAQNNRSMPMVRAKAGVAKRHAAHAQIG